MTGYDQLERQLRDSVRARRPDRRRRPWRSLTVVLAALVVGGGVATAGGLTLGRAAHAGDDPQRAAARAVTATAAEPACAKADPGRPVPPQPFASLRPELRALFPAAAEDRAAAARVGRLPVGRGLIEGTPRLVTLAAGSRVLLYVTKGIDGGVQDPDGCLSARRAALARDRPDPDDAVRRAAERLLLGRAETAGTLQTLMVLVVGRRSVGGAGILIDDARPLPTGVVAAASSGYAGIAVPGARRVTVDGRHFHRSYVVRQRVFALHPPRGTGPLVLRQRAADGRVLARQQLRE